MRAEHQALQMRQRGFMIAPILYVLALAGVGAGVLFTGYSQILRSNIEITAFNTARNHLSSGSQTLAATSVVDTAGTPDLFKPPAVVAFNSLSTQDQAKLPTGYASAGSQGSPHSAGVVAADSGVRQLDPWGRFYVYCKWEQDLTQMNNPAIQLMTAGPDGTLSTNCAHTAAQGDDQMERLSVGVARERANVWQVQSSNEVTFGNDANAVRVNDSGNLTANSLDLQTPLALTEGGTGGGTPLAARTNLGATTVGHNLFTAASGGAGLTALGVSAYAQTLLDDAAAGAAQTTLGISAYAQTLLDDATAGAARTTLGATTVGGNVFTAADAATAQAAIGGTTTGRAVFIAADQSAARTALGATATGSSLFTAADAAAGRTALALGTMATQNANAVAITGGTIAGATITGGSFGGDIGGSTGNIAASRITGVMTIAQGGTGQSTASAALAALGGNNADNITTGTLNAARLADSGVAAGVYNWGTVTAKGIVTAAQNVMATTVGQADTGITATDTGSNGQLIFTVDGVTRMNLNNAGTLTLTGTYVSNNGNFIVDGAAGTVRGHIMRTSGLERWYMGASNAAESGGSAGSDFFINRHNDAGTYVSTPFLISRATGLTTIGSGMLVNGTLTANNFSSSNVNITGGTISGATITGTVTASRMADGTAALPGLAFTNDTDTGFYRLAGDSNTLRVAANGLQAFEINASGANVYNGNNANNFIALNASDGAIEIVRPTDGAYIDFKNLATDDADARIQQASNGLAFHTGGSGTMFERVRITSGGAVGIGTVPAASNDLQIGTCCNGVNLSLSGYANLSASRSGGNTLLGYNLQASKTVNQQIEVANTHLTTGYAGIVLGDAASGAVGDISFYSVAGSVTAGTAIANSSARMIIKSSGNVGIGTTNPQSRLEVSGVARFMGGGSGGVIINQATAPLEIKTNPGAQDFATFSSPGYAGTIVTMNLNTGNVGIGVTDPGAFRLNVNGNTNITGNLNVTGTISGTVAASSIAVADSRIEITDTGSNGLINFITDGLSRVTIDSGAINQVTNGTWGGINTRNFGVGFHPFVQQLFARGTSSAPTPALAGDSLAVWRGGGATSTWPSGYADIRVSAAENLGPNNGGTEIVFATSRLGSAGIRDVARFRADGVLELGNGGWDGTNYGRALQITNADGNRQQAAFIRAGFNVLSMGYNGASAVWGLGAGQATDSSFTPNFLAIDQSTGNVGIGNLSPALGLDVQRDNGNGWVARFRPSSTANGVLIGQRSSLPAISGLNSSGSAPVNLILQPEGANVGIGVTDPGSFRLNVNGNTNVTGTFNATGAVTANNLVMTSPDPYLTTNANNKHIVLSGGSGWTTTGATMVVRGVSASANPGGIEFYGATSGNRVFDVSGFAGGIQLRSGTTITGDLVVTGNIGGTFTGTAANSNQLGGLNSSQFLRADTWNGNYMVGAADGNGLNFWNGNDTYKIYMSSTANGTWGGDLSGGSDYNMYFRMGAGTLRGFVFRSNSTNVAQIDGAGHIYHAGNLNTAGRGQTNWYNINTGSIGAWASIYSYGRICASNSSGDCSGTGGVVIGGTGTNGAVDIRTDGVIYADSAIYGTIYYDANDANFYTDPNATSRVNNLNVIGTLTAGSVSLNGDMTWTGYKIFQRDSTNEQIEVRTTSGNHARIAYHRAGALATYAGLNTSGLWAIGGWSWNDEVFSVAGDGHIRTRNHAAGGWAQISMNGGWTGAGAKDLWIHYGGDSNDLRFARNANNFGAWEANVMRFNMDAPDGSLQLNADGRFNVRGNSYGFQDYGAFNIMRYGNDSGISMGYDDGTAQGWIYARSPGVAGRWLNINNATYIEPGGRTSVRWLGDFDDGNFTLDPNGQSNLNDVRVNILYDRQNTGYYLNMDSVSIFQDIRPSIIYDRDNTGYYLDPHSISYTNQFNANDIRGDIYYDRNNTGFYVNPADTSVINVSYQSFIYDRDNNGFYLDPASTSVTNDFRASIFYDRDDTSYAANPNDWSTLRYLVSLNGDIRIRSGSPTLFFTDSDNRSAMLHNNSDLLYILSGCGAGSEGWCVQANGRWPFLINVSNNNAEFGGNVWAFGYYHHSDARMKHDVKPLEGLALIEKMRGVRFTWNESNKKAVGVIAQEVQKVLPEVVETAEAKRDPKTGELVKDQIQDQLTVDYAHLVAPLIEAVKELAQMVREGATKLAKLADDVVKLAARVDAVDPKLAALEERLNALEQDKAKLASENESLRKANEALVRAAQTQDETLERRLRALEAAAAANSASKPAHPQPAALR